MAKYRVKETSFINNVMCSPGDEIEFDGVPHANLEPIDAAARKAAMGGKEADRESLARQQDAAKGVNLNDPDDPCRKVVKG